MLTDDAVIDLLKESFDADTCALTAARDLPGTVRGKLRRRRAARIATTGTAALAAAAVVAIAAPDGHRTGTTDGGALAQSGGTTAANGSSGAVTGQLKTVRLSSFQFDVPANATVTKTCLPDSDSYAGPTPVGEVFELIPDGTGNYLNTAAGNPCIGATFQFTEQPAAAASQVSTPGQPTVYITAAAPGTRSGYVFLDGQDSRAAAAAVRGGPGRYAVVMTIPSDNDQSVLVSGLRQYHPGDH